MKHDRRARAWYNSAFMLRTKRASEPPEHGSEHGIRLHEGRFRDAEALAPPEWALRGALYSIYPRAFSPEGTLAAILPRIDRIAGLGACALWLLPIHPVGVEARKGTRGSPYAVRDYRAVDPALGTPDDLRRVVDAAHARGLKVIIDFVANHAAPDHVLASEHPEWLARDGRGRPARRVKEWTDVADWCFDADGAAEYLAESAAYWVREAGIDGYRCDVAGMVPRAFWGEVHRRLAAMCSEHFMLAEWQDPELHTIAFHASYDWALYRAVRDTVQGRAKASAVRDALRLWADNFPSRALPLRFLENHDEPRALAIFGRTHLGAAAAVTMLSGGLPLLYNGQEAGATHRPSLFEAEPIAWPAANAWPADVYRDLIELQQRDPWGVGPAASIETEAPDSVVAFARTGVASRGVVIANLGEREETVRLDAFDAAGPFRAILGAPGSWTPGHPLKLAPGGAWVGAA
jgi:glycosidase